MGAPVIGAAMLQDEAIVVVEDPRVDPAAHAVHRLSGIAGVFERLPAFLQEQPLLGVHDFRLGGRDIEEPRVEPIHPVDEASPFRDGAIGRLDIRVVETVNGPSTGRDFADGDHAVKDIPPEGAHVARAGESPGHSDYGYGVPQGAFALAIARRPVRFLEGGSDGWGAVSARRRFRAAVPPVTRIEDRCHVAAHVPDARVVVEDLHAERKVELLIDPLQQQEAAQGIDAVVPESGGDVDFFGPHFQRFARNGEQAPLHPLHGRWLTARGTHIDGGATALRDPFGDGRSVGAYRGAFSVRARIWARMRHALFIGLEKRLGPDFFRGRLFDREQRVADQPHGQRLAEALVASVSFLRVLLGRLHAAEAREVFFKIRVVQEMAYFQAGVHAIRDAQAAFRENPAELRPRRRILPEMRRVDPGPGVRDAVGEKELPARFQMRRDISENSGLVRYVDRHLEAEDQVVHGGKGVLRAVLEMDPEPFGEPPLPDAPRGDFRLPRRYGEPVPQNARVRLGQPDEVRPVTAADVERPPHAGKVCASQQDVFQLPLLFFHQGVVLGACFGGEEGHEPGKAFHGLWKWSEGEVRFALRRVRGRIRVGQMVVIAGDHGLRASALEFAGAAQEGITGKRGPPPRSSVP